MRRPGFEQVLKVRQFVRDANLLVEVRDARAPAITSPTRFLGRVSVPCLVVLSKTDLASPQVTRRWTEKVPQGVDRVLPLDLSGRSRAVGPFLELISSYVSRVKTALGIVRAVIVGLPNVGKSTLINRLKRECVTRVGDMPGVTRGKLWVQISPTCFVLDTPGIIEISDHLLRKFGEDAWKLSLLNIVPENAMEPEDTVSGLLSHLRRHPEAVSDHRLVALLERHDQPMEVLVALAQFQRLKTRGGDPDVITAARRLIGRFRRSELGRISLESPA